ncbi:MAG: hypothetical protein CM1200mP15_21330 [Dehalococcoidia bacterium]|nr:MAG: hypothetical protein CM1200mP15_21330 [Dehalococcoidia bacterium]
MIRPTALMAMPPEVSPRLAYDTNGTISEAVDYFASLNRPNVMIKVPATPEGIPAIRALIGQGINVNVTLIFSVEVYKKVQQAYLLGLEDLTQTTEDLSRVASVASFFVSRVDTAVDDLLSAQIATGNGITKNCLEKPLYQTLRLLIMNSKKPSVPHNLKVSKKKVQWYKDHFGLAPELKILDTVMCCTLIH